MSEELKEDITQVMFLLGEAKKKFKKYIKDKSVPLEERWEFFTIAPDFLKDHKGWVESFKILDDKGIEYYDDFGYERYRRVDTEDLVATLFECLEEWKDRELTEGDIHEIMEEILLKNMGSFTHDW